MPRSEWRSVRVIKSLEIHTCACSGKLGLTQSHQLKHNFRKVNYSFLDDVIVLSDDHHLRDLLVEHLNPPPSLAAQPASLIRSVSVSGAYVICILIFILNGT